MCACVRIDASLPLLQYQADTTPDDTTISVMMTRTWAPRPCLSRCEGPKCRCPGVPDMPHSGCACAEGTPNFNATRIREMYGTVLRKSDHTEVRPHRKSAILAGGNQLEIVVKEALCKLAIILPRAPVETKGYKNIILSPRGALPPRSLPSRRRSPAGVGFSADSRSGRSQMDSCFVCGWRG